MSAALKIETEVPLQAIADTLCSAFEGGSNYWYTISKFIRPPKLEFKMDAQHAANMRREPTIYKHLDYPLNEGGALLIGDKEGDDTKDYRLDLKAVQRGLVVMQRDYPRHFANMVGENGDAETGDVLLQCCLFGKLVYG